MRSPLEFVSRLVFAIAVLAAVAAPARGDWKAQLTSDRSLGAASLANDGLGGVLSRSIEYTGQVYAPETAVAHADSAGNPAAGWSSPYFFAGDTYGIHDAAPDGLGGAFIVSYSYTLVLFSLAHAGASGALEAGWGANFLNPGPGYWSTTQPRVVPDGAGGVYACWAGDVDDVTRGAFLTRRNANGSTPTGWSSVGTRLGTWPQRGDVPLSLHGDGAGGVYVALLDANVRLFRRTALGVATPGWPDSGIVVPTSSVAPGGLKVAFGSDGGMYLSWREGGFNDSQPLSAAPLRVLRVSPAGVIDARWPSGGLVVATGTDSLSTPALEADAGGGVYVAWAALATDGTRSLRGVRLTPDGTPASGWVASGNDLMGSGAALALDNAVIWNEFWDPAVFAIGADGSGGLYVAWDDRAITGTTQVRISRLLANGGRHPRWASGGHLVPAMYGDGRCRAVLGNGADDAFLLWRELAGIPFGTTTLSRVSPDFAAGVGPSAGPTGFALACESGSPAASGLAFTCTLAGSEPGRLELFDVGGRRVRSKVLERVIGAQHVELTRPGELPAGVVFARLSQGRDQRTLRVVVLR